MIIWKWKHVWTTQKSEFLSKSLRPIKNKYSTPRHIRNKARSASTKVTAVTRASEDQVLSTRAVPGRENKRSAREQLQINYSSNTFVQFRRFAGEQRLKMHTRKNHSARQRMAQTQFSCQTHGVRRSCGDYLHKAGNLYGTNESDDPRPCKNEVVALQGRRFCFSRLNHLELTEASTSEL